jgi:DNA invertase Pin-like site-specific DNA recombinase
MPLNSKEQSMSDQVAVPEGMDPGLWNLPLRDGQPGPVPGRVMGMFAVRESDENDRLLFDSMRETTYLPFLSNPWVAAVYREGLAPMKARGMHKFRVELPDARALEVEAEVCRIIVGRTTVFWFRVGPYVHLWSMASAATANASGDNEFTQALVDRVRTDQPQVLVAATIARLVRSSQEGGLLSKVLPEHVDQVWAGDANMVLRGEGSAQGRMQFSVLGTIAAMERDWIVQRLTTGRVASWRRGEWLSGSRAIPFGYELDGKRLVPVPHMRERVRQMLLVLGAQESPSLTLTRLAAPDIAVERPSDGRSVGVSAIRWKNPRQAVDRLLAWVPVWVAGEHLWRYACPLRDRSVIAGVPVMRPEGVINGKGELQLLVKPGVPEGGWAEQEILDQVAVVAAKRTAERLERSTAVRETPVSDQVRSASAVPDLHEDLVGPSNRNRHRRSTVVKSRPRGTTLVAPFSGYTWSGGDGWTYELESAKSRYAVIRRPLPARDITDAEDHR